MERAELGRLRRGAELELQIQALRKAAMILDKRLPCSFPDEERGIYIRTALALIEDMLPDMFLCKARELEEEFARL